jgi:hypothetical protein
MAAAGPDLFVVGGCFGLRLVHGRFCFGGLKRQRVLAGGFAAVLLYWDRAQVPGDALLRPQR